MTKVDGNNSGNAGSLKEDGTDAAALRICHERLNQQINYFFSRHEPRLFNYMELANRLRCTTGWVNSISTLLSGWWLSFGLWIQGNIWLRKGIWVSESRIESGIELWRPCFCQRWLMGPILWKRFKIAGGTESTSGEIYNPVKAKANSHSILRNPIKNYRPRVGYRHSGRNEFLSAYGTGIDWLGHALALPRSHHLDDQTLQLLRKCR